jgi:prepilin-type N-terminal cleavage/methylation domain-containing protein
MISLKNKKGFTIVELLIVIVVIGILATFVIIAYGGIQEKTRNVKRANDINAIQAALEGYHQANGYYPTRTDMNNSSFVAGLKGFDQEALVDPSNPNQDKTLVASPVAKSYAYVVSDLNDVPCETNREDCAKYTLTATMEGTFKGSTTYKKTSLN